MINRGGKTSRTKKVQLSLNFLVFVSIFEFDFLSLLGAN